jgi:hypothetical protein
LVGEVAAGAFAVGSPHGDLEAAVADGVLVPPEVDASGSTTAVWNTARYSTTPEHRRATTAAGTP